MRPWTTHQRPDELLLLHGRLGERQSEHPALIA
jgi:hypothetical protein